jgi:hypothetical protein
MTIASMTQAPFAASPVIARELTHEPDRVSRLGALIVAGGRAVGGFVSAVIRVPILPVEALLEASVLVSMLDGHADRDQVQSEYGTPFDGSLWRGRE